MAMIKKLEREDNACLKAFKETVLSIIKDRDEEQLLRLLRLTVNHVGRAGLITISETPKDIFYRCIHELVQDKIITQCAGWCELNSKA